MKIVNQDRLDPLSCEAAQSERRRKNLNLHEDFADPCTTRHGALCLNFPK